MHPAFSIVFFTTAAGAGYGLLIPLGLLVPLGLLPQGQGFGLASLAVGLGLVVFGLLSSTLHLSHPERAWRAFSQWRSSWLSREGVASVLTFVPAAIFAIGWVAFSTTGGVVAAAGWLMAALAVVSVYCTAMIYASLKPIHQWHNAWVVPNYLVLAVMSGMLLLEVLVHLFGAATTWLSLMTLLAVAVGWALKEGYWRFIDSTRAASTPETATGLGQIGRVRFLDAPHTEANYLLKEMGFRIGRKHASRLRAVARIAGFAVPIVLLLIGLAFGGGVAAVASMLAVASAALGVVAERWLFFAEAKHTVNLYYGAETV
jgi:DMSO reductase anchor subunit